MTRGVQVSRKPDELYIFATSPRTDPYINILVHTTSQFPLTKIHFVSIVEHDYATEVGDERAAATMTNVLTAVHSLAEGSYQNDGKAESIDETSSAVYQKCVDRLKYIQVSAHGVRWNDLDKTLKSFQRSWHTIFDVTALKKNLLVDVVALLLSQSEPEIWTFELTKKPTYGKDDLVHAMQEDRDYNYRCVTDSKHVETATKRMLARALTFRTLAAITAAILIPIVLVEILLPDTWIQSAIVGIGTAVSVASWFLIMKRQ